MRAHPTVLKALKNARKKNRQAIQDAIDAHLQSLIIWPARRPDKAQVINEALYDLLKLGITRVNGQSVDIWMLRFIREFDSAAPVSTKNLKKVVAF
jgi:hypothetical protein